MLADRHAPDVSAALILREARVRAARLGRPVLASWTRPAAVQDALAFFAQADAATDRALWLRPATGEALVGLGAAHVLTARGPGRFSNISDAWRDVLANAVLEDLDGSPTSGPLLLGGFSFDPLHQASKTWEIFTDHSDARLIVPERLLVLRDGAAWLTTSVLVHADADAGASSAAAPAPEQAAGEALPEPAALSPTAWKALVGSVARGIRGGHLGLEKVVLARGLEVRHTQPIEPLRVLRQLAASYPTCTVFAFAHRGACFLGATPERLIALQHGTASTMALAGSISRGAAPAEDQALADHLMRDPKERGEHAVVVGALREGLAQVCSRIVADAEPRVQKLPNVQHLLTRIRGQVTPGRGILDLVDRLHPTPAMGGLPRVAALELIRACESLDRGWYAAPVGWVNQAGEGEFVVGIRSALVQGQRATLFAGCGIVADSNPAAEYAEAGWKLQPMLAALGVEHAVRAAARAALAEPNA